ncbi:type II toxin-antitoxin system PemK/MazF family toxin [Levilactobacillus cerevisiae]|uniref:type II toxin-antitoxin system PemK/MazF family toxin n=1 Tax=Levilactobacillus cerevisiae TaxID=1704076 RepID=UPI000F78691D|nr:type II toxin-antitoxin system PemK/MazF family toxin [Levilactobacillus cerevisiae]
MVKKIPIRQGHLYWVDCEPHAGHEEGGHNQQTGNIRRPVVVVSNDTYNREGMSIVFPITSKRLRSRYLLPILAKRPSSIILSQILGYDMLARNASELDATISTEQLEYLKKIVVKML